MCVSAEMLRDAGDPEVEQRDVVAELLAEREDEPAEAAVDVQADAALEGQRAELLDRVDRAVAVVARRAEDGDRLVVDVPADVGDVDLRGVRIDRRLAQLDAEQVARLVERGVAGLGLHEVRPA